MKFAMRSQQLSELTAASDVYTWTIAAFFFHDRGSEMQKNLTGMLQEILGSVLRSVPALFPFVTPIYTSLVRSQRTKTPKWAMKNLQSALLAIVEQRRVQARILLFSDALDEHHGDNDLLASFLKTLVDKADNGLYWAQVVSR